MGLPPPNPILILLSHQIFVDQLTKFNWKAATYYRSDKHFSNEAYRESLLHELLKVFVNNGGDLQKFCNIDINILKTCPHKRKHAQGNQMPFITKDLSKAIMKRSRLHNNFLKNRTGRKKIYIPGLDKSTSQ